MVPPDRTRVLGCLAALGLLLATAPRPATAVAQLATSSTAADPTRPLVAAVALAAWALALWLGLTALLVLAARTPGLVGRCAAALGRRAAPAAVRHALQVALGVTVTVTGLAVPAAASAGPAAPVSATATTLPSFDWPDLRQSAAPAPVPPVPASAAATAPVPATAPPALPAPSPAPATPAPPVRAAAAPVVVVTPGDTLWTLAEAHLERTGTPSPTDRQVAAAWPRWWSANREAVGDDPDLIRPGTVLQPPRP